LSINSRSVDGITTFVEKTLNGIATVIPEIHAQHQKLRHYKASPTARDGTSSISYVQQNIEIQFFTSFFFKTLLTQLLAVHMTFEPPKPPEQDRQSVSELLKSSLVLGDNDPQRKLDQLKAKLHHVCIINSINIASIVAHEVFTGVLAQETVATKPDDEESAKALAGVLYVELRCL